MKLEFVSRTFLYLKIKIEPKKLAGLFSLDDRGLKKRVEGRTKDDNCHIYRTKDSKLICFLEETIFAL